MKKTNGSIQGGDDAREALVAEAVDDFRERRAKGERPDTEEYAARFPQIADELRRLLPALAAFDASGPATDGDVPAAIGDFRIRREVGRGGMAIVYEAEQISLGRCVALKVLPFASVMDPRQLQRFKNEAQAAAHLHHSHIVPVHSIGCERGVHYYAMQFIEGLSVAQMIEELRAIARRDMPAKPSSDAVRAVAGGSGARTEAYCRAVARLGIQAAEALDHAHQQGVVHRDIKPANLLVDASGHLWITDFGLASFASQPGLTVTGDLVGTVRYMSPEQALAVRVPIDHRTDIYSLGVTLYELLTLETAFPGNDPHQVIQEIANREPTSARSLNHAVAPELETILMKAMAKQPGERFATAQEMADDLARYLRNEPIHARRPTLVQRAGKWARRHAALVWGAAAMLLLALAGLVLGTALLWRERARTETAYDAEASQRARAESNLALALEALDHVYLDEAEVTPKLRPGLSRELLEKGLSFYEQFASENTVGLHMKCAIGRAYLRAGLIYRELGQEAEASAALDAAMAAARAAIQLEPDCAVAYANICFVLQEKGLFEDAITAYREAIRRNPGDAAVQCGLGIALAGSGDCDGAIEAYRATIWIHTNFGPAYSNLGNALAEKGLLDEAIAAHRDAVRVQPELAKAHTNLGSALADKGVAVGDKGLLDEAIAAHREAIRLKGDLVPAYSNLGKAFACEGRFDDAIAACRKAIELQPCYALAHVNLGSALGCKGNALGDSRLVDEAIAEFREAIRLNQDLAAAHSNLGNLLGRRGVLDDAIAEFREAARLQPDLRGVHYNLGVALERKGQLDDAITSYREAIRRNGLDRNAHSNLASVLEKRGEFEDAIAVRREAVRLIPDATTQNGLAWLLATCPDEAFRNPEEAVERARQAVSLAPEDGNFHNTLGVAQYRAGRFKESLDALEQSMRLRSGGDAGDWLFVAMAKWRLGDRAEARAFHEKALAWVRKNAPDDPELRRFAAEAAELLGATKND